MKSTIHNSKIKTYGFTLVETLVAIAILSLAITGPLVIAEKGLSSSLYAQDEVTATYLAQDAIEYVRNVRDDNRLSPPPKGSGSTEWLSPFDSICMASGESCQIDTTITNAPSSAITECSGTCLTPIGLNSSGEYGYGTGFTPTIFTRTVTISTVPSGATIGTAAEAIVVSKVSWQTNIFTTPQSITVSEHIFNL